MKRASIGGAALLFAAVLFWGTTRGVGPMPDAVSPAEAAMAPPSAGGATVKFFKSPVAVPAFNVTTIDGRQITAARGKVTIVNFWATWCPPCRAEIPALVALQAKYPDQLQILGVSEDEEGADVVRAFVAEHKINYPVVMATPEISALFPGVSALPTSFVIDQDGRVMQKHIGLLSATLTELETRALAGIDSHLTVELVEPDKPIGLENEAQAREIPGVNLAALSPTKRSQALRRLNSEGCTCGCGLTVARCRVDDPNCGVSLPIARRIVKDIADQ